MSADGPASPSIGGPRRYRILSLLGSGGFGTVYLAEMLGGANLIKRVAIKFPMGDASDISALPRLLDEGRMLAFIAHHAIVTVDNLVRLDGQAALIMEYVDGLPLSAILSPERHLSPRAALEVTRELASALDAALSTPGQNGKPLRIIHRDPKPSNIMLRANGEVKLLDFGIAKGQLPDRLAYTTGANIPGTLGYLSPERVAGQPFDAPADVFALGAVLFELLTGEGLGQIITVGAANYKRALDAQLATLPELLGDDERILLLVQSLLAWRPEERPTARDVEDACDRLLGSTPGERLKSWTERVIPKLKAETTLQRDEWTQRGEITEQEWEPPPTPRPTPEPPPPPPPSPPPPPPPPKPWWKLLLALVLGGGGLGGVKGLVGLVRTDTDGDGVPWMLGREDCDDLDPAVGRGLPEVCDGKDNDCDGRIDDKATDARTWFTDQDEDGVGGATLPDRTCDQPTGAVATGGDCADQDATVHPGAVEQCDDLDNNCDGHIDEGLSLHKLFLDGDGDGYGAGAPLATCRPSLEGYASRPGDCDDADPQRTTRCGGLSPSPSAHLTVKQSGDGVVELRKDGSRLSSSGEVAPGSYQVWGRDEGEPTTAAELITTITVRAGEAVTLTCRVVPAKSCTRS